MSKFFRRVLKMSFILSLVLLLFVCYKQQRVIKIYKQDYAYFDSVSVVYKLRLDSMERMIFQLTYQQLLVSNIQSNLSEQEKLLKEDPKVYLDQFYGVKAQENLGGGE